MKTSARVFILFVASFAGSFLSAIIFVAALRWSVPPTDQAHEQTLFQTLSDPFVLTIMSFVAGISAIVVFPILYFCLKGKKLRIALPIVFGSVLLEIILVTPFAGNLGWFGSYSALVGALFFCRNSRMESLKL